MNPESNLQLGVSTYNAYSLPLRQLELACQVFNPLSYDVCILGVWLEVMIDNNGLKIGEGNLFNALQSNIASRKSGFGRIVVPLSAAILQRIEDIRAGGDIAFRFQSNVRLVEVIEHEGRKVLGTPCSTIFVAANDISSPFKFKFAQSEWVKILSSLGWSELELLELQVLNIKYNPELNQAINRFTEAQECFRQGDWSGTISRCNLVFEAAIKETTGKNSLKEGLDALVTLIGDPKKAEPINKVILNIKKFFHLARHQNMPHVSITTHDAKLALHLTGAILSYLGR